VGVTSKFVYRKKHTECVKMTSKEDKILIKNIAIREEVGCGIKRLLAEFPDKHWPITTVKRLQRKIDDTAERSTDKLLI